MVLLSFLVATVLTRLVRAAARRFNVVAQPKTDRWHQRPTALLGGVAIFLTVAVMWTAFGPRTPQAIVVIAGSTFLFGVGLLDDFLHVKPYQKLIGQMMAAATVIYSGLLLPWTGIPPLDMVVTVFWLVGITNAVNMLDNMDGLAAGIAAIAAGFLAASCMANDQTPEAFMLAIFAAALLGFLVYNSYPASIFMGDCGSMFVGFFLAGSALLSVTGGRARSLLPVLAVPLLILLIPIFDTTLVTMVRKLSGRAASQGGRDHASHRLVALGMSERHAVAMLYGLAILSGLLALLVRAMPLDVALAAVAAFTLLLTLLGIYLAGVIVYDKAQVQAARKRPLVALLVDVSHKRRVFEVLLDVVLIVLAYYSAYTLLCGPLSGADDWQTFMRVVPILLCVKLATFLATGVYRGLWRYAGLEDLITYLKAVLLGSTASALVVLAWVSRFQGFSPAVFVLDGLILLVMLAATRISFRLFGKVLRTATEDGRRRVLIYGAGDAGDLLVRELRNNRTLGYNPVGFLDDDRLKQGKRIRGLRVFGGNGTLQSTVKRYRVDEVIISSPTFGDEETRRIAQDCQAARVGLRRMHLRIESLVEMDR
ncbi:MAG: hypothetical protein A2V70_08420 [Planctomycetes bacterium RBG_13_63_9]|nr:MAG: hypothetical protein A2V70_08420 [Planctomycetes bacterium RBG_13_63_9]